MGKQGDSHLFLPAIIKVRLAPASKINQREKLLLAVAHCKAPFILKEDHIASKLDSYLIMSGDKNLGTSSPLPFTLRVRCPPASAGSSRQNDLPPGVDGKEATTLSEDHKVPKFESDLKSAPTSTDPEGMSISSLLR